MHYGFSKVVDLSYEEAVEMIRLGVKRIGTSGAKAIANGQNSQTDY